MQGIEQAHCNAAIRAVLTANNTLQEATVEELLQTVSGTYGKKDTLGLDARPEIDIVAIMKAHDENCVVITEETGSHRKLGLPHDHNSSAMPTIYVSDPTDRSSPMKKFLTGAQDKSMKLKEVLAQPHAISDWETQAGAPASITGACSAISCIRHCIPIFSVIASYITQELFVSCSAGNYMLKIPVERTVIDLAYITTHGTKLFFPSIDCAYDDNAHRFVTFVGKEGYLENLVDSKLMPESRIEQMLHYKEPGGPSRILYLSCLQPKEIPIGFILANGEKVGEWIHWLPWIRFARREKDQSEPALKLFEIYRHDQIRIKDRVLMSTPPFYSIFKQRGERMVMDIARFSDFDNPSRIRATLIACPTDNTWATGLVRQFGYRPIEF